MRAFADTNVVLYAQSDDERARPARAILAANPVISTQVLNEFVDVSRRKVRRDWVEIEDAVAQIVATCHDIRPLDLATHHEARRIAASRKLRIYDAQIIASAIEAGCDTLYSEDMHDGLVIDGRLTIRNPFA